MVRSLFSRSAMAAMTSLFVLGAAGGAFAQDADKESVIATVNGKDITGTELEFITEELAPRLGNADPAQMKPQLTGALVDLAVVADAAQAEGLGDSEEFKKQMEYLRQKALRNEYFRKYVDEAITDEDLKAAYDEQIGAMPDKQQVKARHILVKEEDEAKALIKQLDDGADFAELAKENSTGPSGPNGGDLGYFGQGQMVPEFEAAAFALDAGDYTKEPVHTQFGWHVIQVEEKRNEPKPSFEQVKDNLRGYVAQQKFSTLLNDLKEKADINIVE